MDVESRAAEKGGWGGGRNSGGRLAADAQAVCLPLTRMEDLNEMPADSRGGCCLEGQWGTPVESAGGD